MPGFAPNFLAAAAYPEVAAFEAALLAQDWPRARAVYDEASWDCRHLLMTAGGEQVGAESFLRSVVDRNPDDLAAATLLARRLVAIGWNIRTGYRAKHVSREQFDAFHGYLRQAEQILISVTARDPDVAIAWSERLVTARGLELGQSEARRRYDQAIKRTPHFLPAQTQLLQQLCPKWSGDFDTMHAFAAECAAAAPQGAHNAALVVDGHMEHWLSLDGHARGAYLKDPAVQAEIRSAGERCVLHPDFQRTPGWVHAISMFALGYAMIDDWTAARHCFTALGPYGTKWGWQYLADEPEQAFAKYRAKAMGAP